MLQSIVRFSQNYVFTIHLFVTTLGNDLPGAQKTLVYPSVFAGIEKFKLKALHGNKD